MSESSKTPIPSQHQLQAEFEAMVLGDLLELADVENEELTERTVRDRYLVGELTPSNSADSSSNMKTACKPAQQEASHLRWGR